MSKIDSRIALVISDQETNAQIRNLGVGLLELRADLFKNLSPAYIKAQVQHRKLLKIPLLLTLRNCKKEGAIRVFSDEVKWHLIKEVLPRVDMVDIELSSRLLRNVITLAHKLGKKVIVSSHFFRSTPLHLEPILKKALSTRADIVKIAARARNWDDVMNMMAFTHRHRKSPLITMSLGPLGAISRLVLPMAGSMYTYTFIDKPTAAGQVDVKTLKSHLKIYGTQVL